jgi:Flp pilus assembly secretin CpaC
LQSQPRIMSLTGHDAVIAYGAEVPMLTNGPAPAVAYTHLGASFSFTATALERSEMLLKVGAALSHTPANAANAANPAAALETVSGSLKARLKRGQTLVAGGLRQPRMHARVWALPGLSQLPGVGSWFTFNYRRLVEEELVIVVTPRVMSSREAPPVPAGVVKAAPIR